MSNLNSIFDTPRGWPDGSALEKSFAPDPNVASIAEGKVVKTEGRQLAAAAVLKMVDDSLITAPALGPGDAGNAYEIATAGGVWNVFDAGDIVEWDGTAWNRVVVQSGGDPPDGTRAVITDTGAAGSFGTEEETVQACTGGTWAIRATNVGTAVIFAGDSVRFLGTTSTRDGQPTLDEVSPLILDITEVPPAIRLTTFRASTADSARYDAALAQIATATITDTATVASGFALSVDDGSGLLRVLLDSNIPFAADTLPVDSLYVPGVVIDATGLLVPIPGDTAKWELKPRSNADLEIQ